MSNRFLSLILSCAMTSAALAQPVAQFTSFTYTGDDQRPRRALVRVEGFGQLAADRPQVSTPSS